MFISMIINFHLNLFGTIQLTLTGFVTENKKKEFFIFEKNYRSVLIPLPKAALAERTWAFS